MLLAVDDDSSPEILLNTPFVLFGESYTSLYVSNLLSIDQHACAKLTFGQYRNFWHFILRHVCLLYLCVLLHYRSVPMVSSRLIQASPGSDQHHSHSSLPHSLLPSGQTLTSEGAATCSIVRPLI